MYRFALLVIFVTLLSGSVAQAASYQMTNGTIVDPILDVWEDSHSYSGNNLEPYANLYGANLYGANLYGANLREAGLSNATFSPGTTLCDGQTVLQHGFDAASLRPTWRHLLSQLVSPRWSVLLSVPAGTSAGKCGFRYVREELM